MNELNIPIYKVKTFKDLRFEKTPVGLIARMSFKNGLCRNARNGNACVQYNLTPIKKEWYEDEANFPCLCTPDDGINFYVANRPTEASHVFNPDKNDTDRLATEEEVLSLLTKE